MSGRRRKTSSWPVPQHPAGRTAPKFFINSKVWSSDQGYDSTLRALDRSHGLDEALVTGWSPDDTRGSGGSTQRAGRADVSVVRRRQSALRPANARPSVISSA
jgi:hypothetical protein